VTNQPHAINPNRPRFDWPAIRQIETGMTLDDIPFQMTIADERLYSLGQGAFLVRGIRRDEFRCVLWFRNTAIALSIMGATKLRDSDPLLLEFEPPPPEILGFSELTHKAAWDFELSTRVSPTPSQNCSFKTEAQYRSIESWCRQYYFPEVRTRKALDRAPLLGTMFKGFSLGKDFEP
jgi:hypothetical protein